MDMLTCCLGKLGSESAAAKCAAATQGDSNFSIDEEKPYAEVCSDNSSSIVLGANFLVAMDGNPSFSSVQGPGDSKELARHGTR